MVQFPPSFLQKTWRSSAGRTMFFIYFLILKSMIPSLKLFSMFN